MRRRFAGRVMRYGWTDHYHIRYHGRYLWALNEDLAKLTLCDGYKQTIASPNFFP
jgi:hypothetical protein